MFGIPAASRPRSRVLRIARGRLLLARTVSFAAIALVLSTQGAWADNLIADGDGITPVASNNLSFGTVCAGTSTTKPVLLVINRNGNAGSTNVFKDSSSVSVSVLSVAGSGLAASGGGTITMPANWGSLSNGSDSASVTASAQLVAGAAGSFSGSIVFRASGVNASNTTINRDATVNVSATIQNCDSAPPTLNLPSNITAEATGPAGAVVTYSATATDANPANPAVTCTPASGSTFPIATTTVNCSATDAVGNTAHGSFSVTVQDTTPPQILGTPGALSAEATGSTGAIVTYTNPTASDLVDGARPVACTPASGSEFALGATTVNCSASDTRGNSASTSFVVTIEDTTDPVLIVPNDITAEATSAAGAAVTFSASATDVVDGSITPDCDHSSGDTFPLGVTTVSCSATDAAGNSASDSFTITVQDTTAPVVHVPASFSVEASGPSGATTTFTVSASDAVDPSVSASCSPASGATFPLGPTTVTCTATDGSGNTGSASFTVTVVDTTPPALTLPADVEVEATGPGGAAVSFTATASDIVDGSVAVGCSPASGPTYPLGSTTVDCAATDAAGNSATGSFLVKVVDTTAPSLTVPGNITAEATGPSGAAVSYSATASDLVDGAVTPVCTPASGSTFALGTTGVSCTASDAAGNSVTAGFTVAVVDTTAPDLSIPSSITAEATGPSGAAVTYSASASDLVDGSVAIGCSPASGATFPLGSTTVHCSASDAAGNTATGSFPVSVVDTTPPTVTVPANITTGPTSVTGAVVTYSGESATDLVSGSLPVTCAPPSGSSFGFGTTTVVCSASDAAGNTGTNSFTVTVNGFTFAGFYQPVDMGTINTVKNGSTVPIKWELFGAGGIEFTSTASVASGWPKSAKIDCGTLSGLPSDEIEATATGATSLRYDTTAGQFIYNWQTPKQANTCWRLEVKFTDASTKSALFKLK